MDLQEVLNTLSALNSSFLTESPKSLEEVCTTYQKLLNDEWIENDSDEWVIKIKNFCNDPSTVWNYLIVNVLCFFKFKNDSHTLSVHETKQVKTALKNVVTVGISANLLDNLPLHENITVCDTKEEITKYERLSATTYALYLCMKTELKPLIANDFLKWILMALYQILYCPLKKPTKNPNELMSESLYNKLLKDREIFSSVFTDLKTIVHPSVYIRETMLLPRDTAPLWLKRAIASNLGDVIRNPKGVENVARAMLDATSLDDRCDSSKSWKTLDVIAKIVVDCRKLPDFRTNICEQLVALLKVTNRKGEFVRDFEKIFALCTRLLYVQDEELCKRVLIPHVLANLKLLCEGESNPGQGEDVTEPVKQSIRLISLCSIEGNVGVPVLPENDLIDDVAGLLFYLYMKTSGYDQMRDVNGDVATILVHRLRSANDRLVFYFDTLLFEVGSAEASHLKKGSEVRVDENRLIVNYVDFSSTIGCLQRGDSLLRLVKNDRLLLSELFSYLLLCLIEPDKYFDNASSDKQLLDLESEMILDETTIRKMTTLKLLSEITEDVEIQKHIGENPGKIIKYIKNVLIKTLDANMHKTDEIESHGFQAIFIVGMLLQALIDNASESTLNEYKTLEEPLQKIIDETTNSELKKILDNTYKKLRNNERKEEKSSKLTVILEDVCDPLLPVRGHGLMALTKLILEKDKEAMERKQYILNIFQQNLKQDDSYIYLNAIGGLAALADVFTDSVLNVLTDEYSDFCKKGTEDGAEVKMKIGEVLVRVTKTLGEMAPKYKSLLLNTFLNGTKDDDHLIRASSLSNLGEICRVLGFKLGTIVSEVLNCVHAIISTDKAAEPKRAAVMVVRQLFVGLEKDTLVYLKDDILPIYRTLKRIYNNDTDDILRLQAQLALEELNQNVKDFVFPNLRLHNEKNIVMLD